MILLICYTVGHVPHLRDLGKYLREKGLSYSILTNRHCLDSLLRVETPITSQEITRPNEVQLNSTPGIQRNPTALGLAVLPLTKFLVDAAQSLMSFVWPQVQEVFLVSETVDSATGVRKLTRRERRALLLSSSAVILPELNFYYNDLLSLGSALRKNKTVLQIPYSLVNEKEWLTNLAAPRSLFGKAALLGLEWAGSKWVRRVKGQIKSPGLRYLLWSFLGRIDVGNPWLLGDVSGVTTVSLGGFQRRYLLRAGYQKGTLLGAKNVKTEELQKARSRYLSLTESGASKHILTILLPPNQFTSLEDYNNTVVRPVQAAVKQHLVGNWSVRHVTHPRLRSEEHALWSRNYPNMNFEESKQPLNPQVAIAKSSLVLGFSSALLRFCVDLDVKAIDFDVFELGYGDYVNETAVSRASSLTELSKALKSASSTIPAGPPLLGTLTSPTQSLEELQDLDEVIKFLVSNQQTGLKIL